MPTQEQLQNRLRDAGQFDEQNFSTIQDTATIPATSLSSSPSSLTIPEPTEPAVPDFSTLQISGLTQNTPQQDQLQQTQDQLVEGVLDTQGQLAQRSARQGELQEQAGIPQLNQQLTELNQQIRQIQGETFAGQQQAEDRPISMGLIRGEQAQIQRQNAVRTFGLAAAAEAIQGNIALAQDHVNRALEAEFAPLEAQLENQRTLLEVNMDKFDRAEQRRAEALNIQLAERERQLQEQKEERRQQTDLMLAGAELGLPTTALNAIQDANTYEEALKSAMPHVSQLAQEDRRFEAVARELELEAARVNIQKAMFDMNESVRRREREEAQAAQATQAERVARREQANQNIDAITGKILQIDDILNNSLGMSVKVGPTETAREGMLAGIPGVKVPLLGTRLGFGKSPEAIAATATGRAQNFVADVEQLIEQETLDTLIEAKARGATFGALSDTEVNMLKRAASKIGQWKIEEDGRVIGYNAAESDFKRELETIKDLAEKAKKRAAGDVFDTEEKAFFQNMSPQGDTFNPANAF